MVMSRDQNAGRGHNIKTDYRSFELVEQFQYLGINLKNKTMSRKKLQQPEVRECLLSFGAVPLVFQFAVQNIKIQIYRTVILPAAWYVCETWSLTLWKVG
jgi:hypothetical protein